MQKLKVAVLGSGPTAAFAQRAVTDSGHQVVVYSNAPPTIEPPPGAFYIHWVPDSIKKHCHPNTVFYVGLGTEENYIHRQWSTHGISSSFPKEVRIEKSFRPYQVLEQLWGHQTVVHRSLDRLQIIELTSQYDMVICTFPMVSKPFMEQHRVSITVLVVKDVENRHLSVLDQALVCNAQLGGFPGLNDKSRGRMPNFILYNGTDDPDMDWVRASLIGGKIFFEFPYWNPEAAHHMRSRLGGEVVRTFDIRPETKPFEVNPFQNLYLMGRWATWDRRYLTHRAYSQSCSLLDAISMKK